MHEAVLRNGMYLWNVIELDMEGKFRGLGAWKNLYMDQKGLQDVGSILELARA